MVLQKLHQDVCTCVFFKICFFVLPKVLNFGSRSGSVWTCAVHPLKSCYGRGKDVYKINCQAFSMLLSLCPHHLLCFFSIVREIMKCRCHCQQRKHRSWSCTLVWAQEALLMTGWRMWARRSTFTCPLVNVARHAPEHQAHDGGCANSGCSWASGVNWACWCGWVYALLSCTSVLWQNIKESILITKYVSLRLPPSFPKREVLYVVWKSPANCAMWLLFLGEDLEKKHLKVLVVTQQLKIEELRILFRQPEVAFELL